MTTTEGPSMGNNTRIATLLNGAISLLAVVAITLVCIVPMAFAEDGANTSDAPVRERTTVSADCWAGAEHHYHQFHLWRRVGGCWQHLQPRFTFRKHGQSGAATWWSPWDGGENFAISGGTNTFYYDALNAGAASMQTVPMQTLASAKNGARASTSASNTSM